jgi:hypothetical protein
VPQTHAIDGTVLESRKGSGFLRVMSGVDWPPIRRCCEPQQSKLLRASHYFTNLETPTEMERVAGIQTGGTVVAPLRSSRLGSKVSVVGKW